MKIYLSFRALAAISKIGCTDAHFPILPFFISRPTGILCFTILIFIFDEMPFNIKYDIEFRRFSVDRIL